MNPKVKLSKRKALPDSSERASDLRFRALGGGGTTTAVDHVVRLSTSVALSDMCQVTSPPCGRRSHGENVGIETLAWPPGASRLELWVYKESIRGVSVHGELLAKGR